MAMSLGWVSWPVGLLLKDCGVVRIDFKSLNPSKNILNPSPAEPDF